MPVRIAAEFLRQSLTTLPANHAKACAILLLALATAAAQQRHVDEASDLACQALAVAQDQPIMPILQRAQDLRTQLASTGSTAVTAFDEQLDHLSATLGLTASGPRS